MAEHHDDTRKPRSATSRRAILKGLSAAGVGGAVVWATGQEAHAVDATWNPLTTQTLGTRLEQFIVVIKTGEDDLRGPNDLGVSSELWATVEFRNPSGSRTLKTALNLDEVSGSFEGWPEQFVAQRWFKFDLAALAPIGPVVVDHVFRFELELISYGYEIGADNWNMNSIRVLYPRDPHTTFPARASDTDISNWRELLRASGDPVHRFSRNMESSDKSPVWKTVKDRTVKAQGGWRSCGKCQCLVFADMPTPGQCPADRREHSFTGSFPYIMFAYNPVPAGLQAGWLSCNRCHRMTFGGIPTTNMCLAGGNHNFGGSFAYTIFTGAGVFNSKQGGWKSCRRCQGLFFAPVPGACPAGGRHDPTGSWDYMISF